MTILETTEETVSSTEAAKLAGISYRQLDWWARQSVFVPEHSKPGGSGHHRTYTLDEVRSLKLLGELSRFGCPLSTLSTVGDAIRSIVSFESDKEWLLVRPDCSVAFCSSEDLTMALTGSDVATGLVINMNKALSTTS